MTSLLGHVFRMDNQRIPLLAGTRIQERTRSTKSELEECSQQRPTKDGRKQRWQLLTDMDGVGV